MFHVGAFEVEFMGKTATFDVVTVYGLICAAVFLAGFIGARWYEKQEQRMSWIPLNENDSASRLPRKGKRLFRGWEKYTSAQLRQ